MIFFKTTTIRLNISINHTLALEITNLCLITYHSNVCENDDRENVYSIYQLFKDEMTISANYNPSTLKVQRNLDCATNSMNKALERMSTGFKVNRAADDAAGMYVATGLTTQIRGLTQAKMNTQNGISYINTAAGSLENMTSILQRLRDLAVQGSNGVYSDEARSAMQAEAEALTAQLYQIKNGTQFNGKNIFGENEVSPFSTFSVRGERRTGEASSLSGVPLAGSGGFVESIVRMGETEAIAAGYTVIKTAAELDAVRNDLSGKYMLMGDIDLSGFANWDPIGDNSDDFTGTFDGNGHVVKNLKIDSPTENDLGLFGCIMFATIQNICMENVDIKGNDSVGGIVGTAWNSIITNCYLTGSVSGTKYVGGVSGFNSSTITNCYSTGSVSGNIWIGGIAGSNLNANTITNCYSKSSISGTEETGGIAGRNSLKSKVFNCYSSGNVSGRMLIGGVVGNNSSGNINNCYAEGAVFGNTYTGGITGWNPSSSSTLNSFWNTEKTGQNIGIGINEQSDPTKVSITGLTSSQMADNTNFINAGWDNTIWDFSTAPPTLKNMPKPKPPIPPIPPTGDTVLRLQVGANSDSLSSIIFDAGFSLGTFLVDYTDEETSRASIETIDEVINRISAKNSEFGAILNRLDSVLQTQMTQIENLTASRSTIMDADIAEESAIFVKNQILQQTSATLLTQSQSLHKNTILGLVMQ